MNGEATFPPPGQVAADSLAGKPYSGLGGQVDFVRGAAHSRGGLPIIALPSTAAGGTASRIVPTLAPPGIVVTGRCALLAAPPAWRACSRHTAHIAHAPPACLPLATLSSRFYHLPITQG